MKSSFATTTTKKCEAKKFHTRENKDIKYTFST